MGLVQEQPHRSENDDESMAESHVCYCLFVYTVVHRRAIDRDNRRGERQSQQVSHRKSNYLAFEPIIKGIMGIVS
jgi:hypothetical protein